MQTTKSAWQQQLIDGVSDTHKLLALLKLRPEQVALDPATPFPLRVPHDFVARMQPGDPHDPLLLQVLPQAAEAVQLPGYTSDPLNEQQATKTPSLLHKYRSRVLLIATGSCAIHCRYCFRRHFPYQENRLSSQQIEQVCSYIAEHPEVNEVILSGGDPLMLKDEPLRHLLQRLEELPQLQYLRVHTRLPIVIPARVTTELVTALSRTRLQSTVIVHANHPNEISPAVGTALQQFNAHQIPVFNQAVLLRGINDSVDTLSALSHALYRYQIIPYYIHLLDRVAGAGHFAVAEADALVLHRALQTLLPGFLVPRLVKEEAGAASKTLII